ncbi:Ferric iron reductase FhuF-like transporter [Paenibacillus sp. yr247]|uniref:(2Fe-2S)-binding protein n=1 Tax=Paenibacillus sp. yr247 TaxID=1761880 RepID=UPI00088F273B|nr:(2Fe-2S)-binding protein [Paenibacillus sp. yr247]SDN94475.1 Ferric iron reductase FhuF-like transporter [Paenibacillus sp. yr247]
MSNANEIWEEIKRFSVEPAQDASVGCFELSELLSLVKERMNAQAPHIAASLYMRHAAFIFVGRLFALSKYRVKWTGELRRIGLADRTIEGRWAPLWTFADGDWAATRSDREVAEALQAIVCGDARKLVQTLAGYTNSSQAVLWENIWGYVLWMYVQLMQEPGECAERARSDLQLLLDKSVWEGVERKSPFTRFLGDQTPEAAMAAYKRVTCCFYYEVPGFQKCSYCPTLKTDEVSP